jgi:hypothetical protein
MTHSDASSRAPAQPSLQDCICLLYEHSLVPVREIARLAGLTERSVYATVRRRGCRPRVHVGEGGGRRLTAPARDEPRGVLDLALVQQAIAACAAARQRALDDAAARAAASQARARRAAEREAERERSAESRARLQRVRALLATARLEVARWEAAQAVASRDRRR